VGLSVPLSSACPLLSGAIAGSVRSRERQTVNSLTAS